LKKCTGELQKDGGKPGKEMKILVACVDMLPQNFRRQPWYYMNSLAQGLLNRGHDVWILTNKQSNQSKISFPVILENYRYFSVGINKEIIPLIKKEEFDVIIWSLGLTDFFFKNNIDILKIPVIAVVTSPRYFLGELLTLGKEWYYNNWYLRQLALGPFISKRRIKGFLKLSNLKAIVFQCQLTRNRYISGGFGLNKTYIVPPPLPEEFLKVLKGEQTNKFECNKVNFRVLYLGPPLTHRGLDTLIHAMSKVTNQMNNIELYILSRIEDDQLLNDEHKMRNLIKKKGIAAHTHIISGLLSPEEIAKHILCSDVVCLPFKFVVSDVPLVILETIALGVPIITTERVGVAEFVKDNKGIIVPPGNHEALANSLIHIIKNRKGKSSRRSFDESFLSKFSLTKFVDSYERILSESLY